MKIPKWLKTLLFSFIVLLEIVLYILFRDHIRSLVERYIPFKLFSIEKSILAKAIFMIVPLVNAWIVYLLLRFGYSLYFFPNRLYIERVFRKAKNWLLSSNLHWGSNRMSKERNISNTIEGILGLTACGVNQFANEDMVLTESTSYILNQICDDGLLSISMGTATVHCTAMGLYTLQFLKKNYLYTFSFDEEKKINKLTKALLNSKGKNGWGISTTPSQEGEECRIFSTLWALRALNQTDYADDFGFRIGLYGIINCCPDRLFGFSLDDSPKVSMISLFLILIFELKNEKLKSDVLSVVKIRDLIDYLITALRLRNFIEFEEYHVQLGKIYKLSWIHISGPLALHALSLAKKELKHSDLINLNRCMRVMLKKCVIKETYFAHNALSMTSEDPKTFPTSYLLQAIGAYLSNFNNDEHVK